MKKYKRLTFNEINILNSKEKLNLKNYIKELESIIIADFNSGEDPEESYNRSYYDLRIDYDVDWDENKEKDKIKILWNEEDKMLKRFRSKYRKQINQL
jgi:hypothetical protein